MGNRWHREETHIIWGGVCIHALGEDTVNLAQTRTFECR